MRLLNVYTFEFANFEGKAIPPYAIASHRWCNDDSEATLYVDILEGKNTESEGYKKIPGFCDFTKSRNEIVLGYSISRNNVRLEWIWIDSCCIDRRSSAEIAENITSMYKYYERAAECYAYLADVPHLNGEVSMTDFQESDWFKRGWTLQELLAPSRVFFISADWTVIGHKCSEGSRRHFPRRCRRTRWAWGQVVLNDTISDITGIDAQILDKRQDPRKMPPELICQWIENRETKKEEDLAYCLLGLLGVFMVPNYGEGDNAWSRLEEEVSKKRKQVYSLPRPNQLQSDVDRLESSDLAEPSMYSRQRPQRRRLSTSTRPLTVPLIGTPEYRLSRDREQDEEVARIRREFEKERELKEQEERQYKRRLHEKWEAEQAERKRMEQEQYDRAIKLEELKLKEEKEKQRKEMEEYLEYETARRQHAEILERSRSPQQLSLSPYRRSSSPYLNERRVQDAETLSPTDQTTTTKTSSLRNMAGLALSTITLGTLGVPLVPLSLPSKKVQVHHHRHSSNPEERSRSRDRTYITRENSRRQLESSRNRDRVVIVQS